jgi:3'(2'), 5'-bisphosphate nucleotidase
MINLDDPEIAFAVHAVSQAGTLVSQVQKDLVAPALMKSDHSPVTVADYVSQALASYYLMQAFPSDPLVAEEDAETLRSESAAGLVEQVTAFIRRSLPFATPQAVCEWIDRGGNATGQRFWTLDPIDGTKGFLRGDQYAIALALVLDGMVQIGVLGCPNLTEARWLDPGGPGSLVIAVRGMGTWTCEMRNPGQFTRLQVSQHKLNKDARLLRSYESGHTNVDNIQAFQQQFGSQQKPVLMDSQAKYAVLAAGEAEILLRLLSNDQPGYREKIWDQAAGSLVLEEAGGRISDLDGKDLDFSSGRTLAKNRGLLATNRWMHPAALEALRAIGISK